MTTTAVQKFFETVEQDEALQAELAQALEAENDREAVTQLAKAKGYDFSPEELWTEVQKRQSEAEAQIEAGELNDDELEQVAGGLTPVAAATIVGGAFTASATLGVGVKAAKW